MISESNLNRYRLFCAVAECESISRAAEMNYISQPAISKAITKITGINKNPNKSEKIISKNLLKKQNIGL